MYKARYYLIRTNVVSDEGETILSQETIENAIKRHRGIKRWAYILHNKDVHSAADAKEKERKKRVALREAYAKGVDEEISEQEYVDRELEKYMADKQPDMPKKPHWHIVLETPGSPALADVAKWFGVPEHMIKAPGGGDRAFLDGVEYLTHEDEKQVKLGKYLYPDNEVISNIDFRSELTKRKDNRAKYGGDLSPRDKMRADVLYFGKTLRECMAEDRLLYMADFEKLKKLRFEFLINQRPPKTRINYYVCGRGGVGKGLISRALARSLYPQYDNDEDIFFEVGAKGAAFEGYDGQPVVIWNDRRAVDLLTELNGRGNVFNVFDTHPTKQRQNVKYGSVCLCNQVNIVNSIQDYTDFLLGLSGNYTDRYGEEHSAEDKGQSYRRFPFIIPLHEDDFDLLLNKGFVENTSNFEEYIEYLHICGNMQTIATRCGANQKLANELQAQMVQPVINKHLEVVSKLEHETEDEKVIRQEFADYGKRVPSTKSGEFVQLDFVEKHDIPF